MSDEIFEVYREMYDYDPVVLEPEVEDIDTSYEDWTVQKVAYNTAYDGQRMFAYLFLPNNAAPPYQTVVYMPGSASLVTTSSEHFSKYYEIPLFLDFVIKSGRAVLFPVYHGTFERSMLLQNLPPLDMASGTHEFSEHIIRIVKDFRVSLDYLSTRDDINIGKLAFYGMSFGAAGGPIFGAVEDRISANIYVAGGLGPKEHPEVQSVNFLPRVTAPTLIVNGVFDAAFIPDSNVKPMFDLLGTPEHDKKLFFSESDHIPLRNDMIREITGWLDQYFGPVNRLKM